MADRDKTATAIGIDMVGMAVYLTQRGFEF